MQTFLNALFFTKFNDFHSEVRHLKFRTQSTTTD